MQRDFWESEAANWIAWARTPGHDAYWDYSPSFFDEVVPSAGTRTLEIGCGEGRVTRDLAARGHAVSSIDASPSMIAAARGSDPDGRYLIATGDRLPFRDAGFDIVVMYNVLMDVDDMPATMAEVARVLEPGGRLCACVTHPMIDVGRFEGREADARFVIDGDYLGGSVFDQTFERAGLVMRFRGLTYPLEAYSRALEDAGLLIEMLREPAQTDEQVKADPAEGRWQRLPNFLFLRAVKASA
jgi:SAM-dependent methyltransferase